MLPRTFFVIVLRVLGILVLKELLVAVPQFIFSILTFLQHESISSVLAMAIAALLWIAAILWISYTLVYKADRLVTKFALDAHIAEPSLELNFSIRTILLIAIIVTGGVLLINELPNFCRLVYNIFQQKSITYFADDAIVWSPIIISVVKIIIALLIIGERKRVLNILNPEKIPEGEQSL